MPTYQYACTECGHSFDVVQSFSEDSLTVCPECGGRLRKVFNAVGVVFKGSGFYRTDSRGKQTSAEPATATSSSSESGGASGSSAGSANGSTKSDAVSSSKGSTTTTKSESSKA